MNTTTNNIHNQHIITDDNYKGLPLTELNSGYYATHLDSTLNTIDGAMGNSSRLIQTCFTLSFPPHVNPMLEIYSSKSIGKFLKALQGWAIKVQNGRGVAIQRKAKIDFIWQKDVLDSGMPVYRVMLLLNPEAYYHQGKPAEESTLLYRIQMCWGRVINQPITVAAKLVNISGKLVTLTGNDMDALIRVFSKASRLCAAPTGTCGLGSHDFGSSR
jgi:hypothetical protein